MNVMCFRFVIKFHCCFKSVGVQCLPFSQSNEEAQINWDYLQNNSIIAHKSIEQARKHLIDWSVANEKRYAMLKKSANCALSFHRILAFCVLFISGSTHNFLYSTINCSWISPISCAFLHAIVQMRVTKVVKHKRNEAHLNHLLFYFKTYDFPVTFLDNFLRIQRFEN